MRFTSPHVTGLITASFVSVMVVAFLLINTYVAPSDFWKYIIVAVLSTFLITYISLYFLVKGILINKVKPIYKIIKNTNVPLSKLSENFEDKDIVAEVEMEVAQWARTKTREIDQLKKMEKYRKEFLGNVSHELKTPLFNIQGYVLTLLDGGLEDEAINRLYLERAEKSLNRLITIVEDLESISRLESGELQLQQETFNIVQLAKEVFEMLEIKAKKKNIKLQFMPGADRAIMVVADRKRIYEVLNNLVINSINYGKEGGKTTFDFHDMDSQVLVEVSDDGIGINEKHLTRLFERFYRVDQSRSREQGGTGLGLSIVKHILEAHKQTINVSSKPGEGSSFSFTLQKVK